MESVCIVIDMKLAVSSQSILDVPPDLLPVPIVLLPVHAVFQLHIRVHVNLLSHLLEEFRSRLLTFITLTLFHLARSRVARSVLSFVFEGLGGRLHLTQFLILLSLGQRASLI